MSTEEEHIEIPFNKILVFSVKITNRLRYILEEIFQHLLGLELEITSDQESFVAYEGPKVNYSYKRFDEEIFFYSSPLLFERRLKLQKIKVEEHEGMPIFFISKNNSHIPFDIFAASFFLMSRYEEYFETPKDQHGRFQAEESVAYKNGFLKKPIVNIWVNAFAQILKEVYPAIVITPYGYRFIPTYDVDIAYAYRYKGLLRTMGGYLLNLRNADFEEFGKRTKILLGREKDPYDTFDWMFELQKKYKLNPVYFFLVGEYSSYDKNISVYNAAFQNLIQSIGDFCEVGIHPSYLTNTQPAKLAIEVNNLSGILKKEIKRSRQHYLKLEIPMSYERIMALDIYKDYTMGYSSQLGFRAGTASSFFFYDLSLEIKTRLKIYPFAVMDVTLRDYLKLSKKDALKEVKSLIREVKAVNGLFMTLFHNSSFSEIQGWEGWQKVYEDIVKYAVASDLPSTAVERNSDTSFS